ncbi:MAG: hypothetical protein KDN18_18840 [Verrucomicrobiae bacterium]|nr:hypothetical protein [Verrucomicrobiae bacterium]
MNILIDRYLMESALASPINSQFPPFQRLAISALFDGVSTPTPKTIQIFLQERCTVLISAAVIGQIDVRQIATREDAA